MTIRFLTLVLAATFFAVPALAQTTNGKVIAVEENYATQADGKVTIERTILKQHDNNVAVPAVNTSTPVLVYDDIEEPFDLNAQESLNSDQPHVIYHVN